LSLQLRAYEHFRNRFGDDHPDTLRVVNNVGAAYARANRFEEALAWYWRSYEARISVLGADHGSTLFSMHNVAATLLELKRYDESAALFAQLIDRSRATRGAAHRQTLIIVRDISRMNVETDRPAAAIANLEEIVEAVEAARMRDDLSPENRRGLFVEWARSYRRLACLYAQAGRSADAFRILELAKARTLLESLLARAADRDPGVPDAARARLDALARQVSAIGEAAARATDPVRRATLEGERNALLREAGAFRRDLASTSPRYRNATEVRIVSADEAARALDVDEAFVTYVYSTAHEITAVVVTPDRPPASVAVGDLAWLHSAVTTWRMLLDPQSSAALRAWRAADGTIVAGLTAPSADATPLHEREIAAMIAQSVVAPLAAHVEGKRRWIVSPDGPLALVPFAALPDGRGAMLGDRITLRYTPSFSVLQAALSQPASAQKRNPTLLGVGAPTYAAAATIATPATVASRLAQSGDADAMARMLEGVAWAPLPGAKRELSQVAGLFRGRARLLLDDEATESNLIRMNAAGELAGFRYVHVAAHAFVAPSQPSLSSIVLAQPDGGAADGYLTAAELIGYAFDSDLFVASACETASGTYAQGEGLLGLAYALAVAGNRASALTLWRVDDAFAAHFVERLFRRVRAGATPSEALAATQRELRRNTRWRAPAYWAAFVVHGSDTRASPAATRATPPRPPAAPR
jgi:CHAT domain-containing protein